MGSPADPVYDVFVSYAEDDQAWVHGELFHAFEEAGISYLDENNLELGAFSLGETETALRSSRRVVLVLSKEYRLEGEGATTDMTRHLLSERRIQVIPIVRSDGVPMPTDLKMLIQLDMRSKEDWEEGFRRLREALGKEVINPSDIPECPYRGMQPYNRDWSEKFFGRGDNIAQLADMVRTEPLAVVIGPSGSGKSSLVQAGLIRELERRDSDPPWGMRVVTPGRLPMSRLAHEFGFEEAVAPEHLAQKIGSRTERSRLLLVIDQAEQMVGAGSDGSETMRQLKDLAEVLGLLDEHDRVRTVLTIRSDFGLELAASPLGPALRGRYLRLGQMSADGLRDAIVLPAEQVGVFIEPALVEALVKDAAAEPGLLPFVQETMVMLWGSIERRYIALENYSSLAELLVVPRSGYPDSPLTGLQVAMAQHAEKVFGRLRDEETAIGNRVLIRLIQFVEGRSDVRRQQPITSLISMSDQPGDFDHVIEVLAAGRLITTDSQGPEGEIGTIDLSHEALIGGWPRLSSWVMDHRDLEVTRRRLRGRAIDWKTARDSHSGGFKATLGQFWGGFVRGDGLLDHNEIEEAIAALADPRAEALAVSEPDTDALVSASRGWMARRRLSFALLIGLAVVVGVLGLFAIEQQRRAEAEANRATALLLAQAADADPEQQDLALRFALEAVMRLDSIESRSGLKTALELSPEILSYLPAELESVLAVATSPDGSLVAIAGEGEPNLILLDAEDSGSQRPLEGHREEVLALAFSPDGRWLASASRDDTVRVWDTGGTGSEAAVIEAGPPSALVEVCRQGYAAENQGDVRAVHFDAASSSFAIGGHNGVVELFRVGTWERTNAFEGHLCDVTDLAFHPESRTLASSSRDGTVRIWDLDSGRTTLVIGQPDQSANDDNDMRAVAWHPGGQHLAFSGNNRLVRLYDLANGTDPEYLGAIVPTQHDERVFDLAFNTEGTILASAAADRTVDIAEIRGGGEDALAVKKLRGHRDAVRGLAFLRDGRFVSGSQDGTVILWDPGRDIRLGVVSESTGSPLRGVAHLGDTVLAVNADGETMSFEPGSGGLVEGPSGVVTGTVRDIEIIDDVLAVASSSGGVFLFDLSGTEMRSWQAHQVRSEVIVGLQSVGLLASGGVDEGGNGSHLRLWDLVTGAFVDEVFLEDCDIDHAVLSPDRTEIAVACNAAENQIVGINGDRFNGSISRFGEERLIMVAFAGDGWLYGGGEDGRLTKWQQVDRYRTGNAVFDAVGDEIRAIAFDQTMMRGAAGTESGAVLLFDLPSGRLIGRPWEVGLSVSDLSFSPQGTELAVVGTGSTTEGASLILLEVDEDEWRRRACEVAPRALTEAEWIQLVGTDESLGPCGDPSLGQ